MRRPKGGKNSHHSKEEKLSLVRRVLEGETLRSLERKSAVRYSHKQCVGILYKVLKKVKGKTNS